MATYKLISADSHIVEPPDLYTSRIEPPMQRSTRMASSSLKLASGMSMSVWRWFIHGV